MIGEKISPVLTEIENALWEFEVNNETSVPNYTDEGFRSAIKIFGSAILDKMWKLQEDENISFEDRSKMAMKAGDDIRQLVKVYTGVDPFDLYKNIEK